MVLGMLVAGPLPDLQTPALQIQPCGDGRIAVESGRYKILILILPLMAYCRDYRFSFSWEEFLEQRPEERLRQQFAHDPIWGG
jgi:hypothetical protein